MARIKPEAIEKPSVSVFKGHRILSIPLEDGMPFAFGEKKARAIMDNLSSILSFLEGDDVE